MKQFCMKIDLISQERENVLFVPSNMAAMTSHENALFAAELYLLGILRHCLKYCIKVNLREMRPTIIGNCKTSLNSGLSLWYTVAVCS